MSNCAALRLSICNSNCIHAKFIMDKTKRDRSANFTLMERDILVSLVKKNQSVLENKKSDASSWKSKEATWENIKNEFNARSGAIFRSRKTLKNKYESLKRSVRKKSAAIRSQLYRTGGGQNKATPLDSVEEQIRCMITLSADGLESIYDSDQLPLAIESQDVDDCSHLKGLKCTASDDIESKIIQTEPNQSDLAPDLNVDKFSCVVSDVLPNTSSNKNQEKGTIDEDIVNGKVVHDIPTATSIFTPIPSTSKKWDASSRRRLKSKKNVALIAKVPRETIFDELTQSKLELVEKQKELLELEILAHARDQKRKEEEHTWKEEEHKLKMEILKKELNK